jgi:hypothetical protein
MEIAVSLSLLGKNFEKVPARINESPRQHKIEEGIQIRMKSILENKKAHFIGNSG